MKQLSPTEWKLAVRILADVEHVLHCLDGCTVSTDMPSTSASFRLNLLQEIRQLERAQRLLGFNPKLDPFPPQTEETYVNEADCPQTHHLDA